MRFIFGAHAHTSSSLVTWLNRGQTNTLIGLLIEFISFLARAYPLTKRKNGAIRAIKASVVNLVRKRCLQGTCRHIELCGFRENNEPVLLFGNITVNPVWSF